MVKHLSNVASGQEASRPKSVHCSPRASGPGRFSLSEQLDYIRHLKRLADFKFGAISRFIQFCFIGTTGMVVDLAGYALLLNLSITMPLARALAICVAMTWNFFLNRWLTFSDRREQSILGQYLRFVASCAFGGFVNWSVNFLLVRYASWFAGHLLIAAFIGILVGTIINFLLSHHWVFKRK